MSKPISFDVSRGRDENEIIKQLVQAYNISLLQSNQTLSPIDINATFSCVEALFQNFQHKIEDKDKIKSLIDDYKAEYFEAVGIKDKLPGIDRGSLSFLVNLNEKVKTIFVLVMEALSKK